MRIINYTALLTILLATIAGCGQSTPECDSSKVQRAVLKRTTSEMTAVFGEELMKQADIKLTNIRTLSVDAKNLRCSCIADLMTSANGRSITTPLMYSAEYPDGSSDLLIVVKAANN